MTAVSFDILGRDKASQAFDKVSQAADRTERKFGFLSARTGGLTAGMAAGFGKIVAAMGAVATVQVFTGFINEARDARKVSALTESIIKSTGGAAKISAKQVGALAEAISNKTGVDDEAVQSGANLLLTFKNVRNEVGKGANIFDRATAAAVDLSAAGFGEVSATSKMLGKALNDPLKGITALGRAGVTFTADQKKQIATLVETGKTLEAQKIILQEVESQVGGAAAAAADPMQKLGVIVGNLKERIGTAFLPIIDKAATVLGNILPGAVDKASVGFKALGSAFREGDVTSDGFVGAMETIGATAGRIFRVFRSDVLPILKEFGTVISGSLLPKLRDFAGFGAQAAEDASKWARGLIGGLRKGLESGDWKPLGKAIGDGLAGAFRTIGDNFSKVTDAIGSAVDKVNWGNLGTRISSAIIGLIRAVDWKRVGDALGDAFVTIVSKTVGLAEKLGNAFKDLMQRVDWEQVGRDSTSAIGKFVSGVDWGSVAKTLGVALLKSLKINVQIKDTIINSAGELVKGIAVEIGSAIGRWFKDAGTWLSQKGRELLGGLKRGAETETRGIGAWISQNVITPVISAFKDAPKWLVQKGRELFQGLVNGIWSVAKDVDDWILRAPVAKLMAPWYSAGKWLVKHGANFLAGFITGVASVARTIGNWMGRNVISPLVGAFSRAGTWLVQQGRNLIAGFTGGVTGFLRSIKGIGTWMYNNVAVPAVTTFAKAGSWLGRAGRDLIGGLTGGIATRMKGIGSWIKSQVVDPIVSAVKTFFGIKSPSKVFEGIGLHLIGGLMKGLGSGRGTAIAKKVFGDMPSALRAVVGKGLVSISSLPNKALDALLGAGGDLAGSLISGGQKLGNRRVFYSGEQLDLSTFQKVQKAQGMLGGMLNITQGSYERASSYSGTTHTGGGVFDVVGGNLKRINAALRSLGFASWIRSPSQGPWPWHIHALEIGNPNLSASARRQVLDYAAGGDGLGGYKLGTPWVPNDQLALLHKGEAVIPEPVNRRMRSTRAGGTQRVVLEFRSDGSAHMDYLVNEFRKYVRVVGGGSVQQALGVNR